MMWQIKYSNSSSKYIVIVVVFVLLFFFVIELWIEVCQHYLDIHLKTLIVLHFHILYIAVDNVSHISNWTLNLHIVKV